MNEFLFGLTVGVLPVIVAEVVAVSIYAIKRGGKK